jgi:ATP-dependent Clp protease ATP-binding subunit ClpA
MLEFNYIKTEQGWPLTATGGGLKWEFSGSFDPQFGIKHTWLRRLNQIHSLFAWLLIAAAILTLALKIYLTFPSGITLSFFAFSGTWLVFWLGALAGTFLWANQRFSETENSRLNLQKTLALAKRKQTPVDLYELFTPQAKLVWQRAGQISVNGKKTNPTTYQLFLSLLKEPQVQLVFARFRTDTRDIETIVKNYTAIQGESLEQSALEMLPFVAVQEAVKLSNRSIDPLMLLCALACLLPPEHIIQSILLNLNLNQEKLETVSAWIFEIELLKRDWKIFHKLSHYKPDSEINAGLTSLPTYILDRYSQDLTYQAKHGALPWALGRGPDILELLKLASQGQNRLVIRGEPGSGRTTLINELAFKMASEQVPEIFADKRLVRLELSAVLGNPQKSEAVLLSCLKEAELAGNIVLVIEEVEQLTQGRTASGLSLLEILLDHLQNSNLPFLLTTTQAAYTEYLRPAANFESIFSVYELSPLSHFQIMLACSVRASLLEAKHHCLFHYPAIETAVRLTDAYIQDLDQPQKAIAILVEAAGQAGASQRRIVSEELIEKIVSQKTHIPARTLKEEESEKLLNLEEEIAKSVIGQKPAVVAVAEGLRRSRSGLASGRRPLGSFLFLGPTGVGKTEIAKTLARVYFGDPKLLLRLDMSEYAGEQAIEKFLGNKKGQDSSFIAHIKNYPFSLLLLDELEKASTEIHNLFLQILDDGRITSSKGQTLDLTHCLIIATSNAGSREIQAGIKSNLSYEQIKSRLVNEVLPNFFAPELINRFDSVVVFSPLTPTEVQQVAMLQLQDLQAELLDKGLQVEFSTNVLNDIAQNAYDPKFGARPVRRYIQDRLESFVAKLLLTKKYSRGQRLEVDLQNGKYTVSAR